MSFLCCIGDVPLGGLSSDIQLMKQMLPCPLLFILIIISVASEVASAGVTIHSGDQSRNCFIRHQSRVLWHIKVGFEVVVQLKFCSDLRVGI